MCIYGYFYSARAFGVSRSSLQAGGGGRGGERERRVCFGLHSSPLFCRSLLCASFPHSHYSQGKKVLKILFILSLSLILSSLSFFVCPRFVCLPGLVFVCVFSFSFCVVFFLSLFFSLLSSVVVLCFFCIFLFFSHSRSLSVSLSFFSIFMCSAINRASHSCFI